jgi:hypothetical protein
VVQPASLRDLCDSREEREECCLTSLSKVTTSESQHVQQFVLNIAHIFFRECTSVECRDPLLEGCSLRRDHCCSRMGANAHVSRQNRLRFRVTYHESFVAHSFTTNRTRGSGFPSFHQRMGAPEHRSLKLHLCGSPDEKVLLLSVGQVRFLVMMLFF